MIASDLRLADCIRLFDGEFGDGIVTKIESNAITIFRPYATTADFSYVGGVIPYIGTETVHLNPTSEVHLLRRAYPLR